jgi:transcriptional regulator with XRE-family HTH domain
MDLRKNEKRSSRIIMTNEARALKELRLYHGYSMKKAGELMGLSDSYIAHLETGRMDIPKGDKLDRILAVYGGIKAKSFYERARNYQDKITPRDELLEVIERLPDDKVPIVLNVAKSL